MTVIISLVSIFHAVNCTSSSVLNRSLDIVLVSDTDASTAVTVMVVQWFLVVDCFRCVWFHSVWNLGYSWAVQAERHWRCGYFQLHWHTDLYHRFSGCCLVLLYVPQFFFCFLAIFLLNWPSVITWLQELCHIWLHPLFVCLVWCNDIASVPHWFCLLLCLTCVYALVVARASWKTQWSC